MKAQINTPKTNPSPQKGMEIFLNAPNPNKTNETQKEQPPKKEEIKIKEEKDKAIEEKIEQIEQELKNVRQLDLSTFNNLLYQKNLLFKVLFIRTKIYTIVRDNTSGKMTIVAVLLPRWGGTGLRYMISQCSTDYCRVVEKQTNKGKILTYMPIQSEQVSTDDIDDIFD